MTEQPTTVPAGNDDEPIPVHNQPPGWAMREAAASLSLTDIDIHADPQLLADVMERAWQLVRDAEGDDGA